MYVSKYGHLVPFYLRTSLDLEEFEKNMQFIPPLVNLPLTTRTAYFKNATEELLYKLQIWEHKYGYYYLLCEGILGQQICSTYILFLLSHSGYYSRPTFTFTVPL